MAVTTTRSRDTYDRSFRQTMQGEQQHGQTPTGMFLETYNSHTVEGLTPRTAVIRRSVAGKLSVCETLRTRDEVLGWVLRISDGKLTAFDHDDYSARLIVQDDAARFAWIEMLNPDSDPDRHPELEG